MSRFRALYGAGPLHLLALLASFALAGAAVVRWFDASASDSLRVLIWFAGAIALHDVILLPLYHGLDRLALRRAPVGAQAYVRVPAIVCAIVGLAFFPEILRLGNTTYHAAAGGSQNPYLVRYLIFSGVLFVLSGVLCALRSARRS